MTTHDGRAAGAVGGWLLIVLAYLGFISLGLPDGVLGLVWPELQRTFELPRGALGAPLAVGAVTYFLSGLSAGHLTRLLGVGGLLAGSTALVTVGIAAYALAPSFWVFLAGAGIVGFGSGAIDSGLNVYAARYFRARHMTWLHAAYSLGAASGPGIVTVLFALGASFRAAYATLGVMLATLGVAFAMTRRRWVDPERAVAPESPRAGGRAGMGSALRDPRVRLQCLLFFTYTGVEVGAGQWSYTLLTEGRGVGPELAGVLVTVYWACLLVGRVLAGFVVERVGTARLVRAGAIAAALGTAMFAWSSLPVSVSALGLWLTGLALAPIFPGLMGETPRRVGDDLAPFAVGFQVSAATTGVAVLPNAAGWLGEWLGLSATGVFIALDAAVLALLYERLIRVADRKVAAPCRGPGR